MMKHLYRILCVTLVVGSMLASCSKKEIYTITTTANDPAMGTVSGSGSYEADEVVTLTATPGEGFVFMCWNDGVADNPRTVTVTADAEYVATFALDHAISVTFGTESWTAGLYRVAFSAQYNAWRAMAFGDTVDNTFPTVDVFLNTITPGIYHDDFVLSNFSYAGGIVNKCHYYEKTGMQGSDGNMYGDWWAKTVDCNLTAFDPTACTMSAIVSGVYFSAYEMAIENVAYADASTRDFSITLGNVPLSAEKGELGR